MHDAIVGAIKESTFCVSIHLFLDRFVSASTSSLEVHYWQTVRAVVFIFEPAYEIMVLIT